MMRKVAILVAALPIVAAAQQAGDDPTYACYKTVREDKQFQPLVKRIGAEGPQYTSPEALSNTKKATPQERAALLFYAEGLSQCQAASDDFRLKFYGPEQFSIVKTFDLGMNIALIKQASGQTTWAQFYESAAKTLDTANSQQAIVWDRYQKERAQQNAAAQAAKKTEEERQAQAREYLELQRQQLAQQAAAENERNRIMQEQARQANINNAFNNLINATQPRFAPPMIAPSFDCSSRTYGQTTYTNCR